MRKFIFILIFLISTCSWADTYKFHLMGYLVLPEGHYEVKLNMNSTTEFYKIGDTIGPFKILDFKKVITESTHPETGVIIYKDESAVTLESPDRSKHTLHKGIVKEIAI